MVVEASLLTEPVAFTWFGTRRRLAHLPVRQGGRSGSRKPQMTEEHSAWNARPQLMPLARAAAAAWPSILIPRELSTACIAQQRRMFIGIFIFCPLMIKEPTSLIDGSIRGTLTLAR